MASLSHEETLDQLAATMAAKATLPWARAWILAMLAGAYIALAAFGSTMISANLLATPASYGLGRCVAGLIFPVGLILVVIAGGELFTGNCLMPEALRRKLITPGKMLASWILVYLGNFTGAIFIAAILFHSGIFHAGGGVIAAAVIKTAIGKALLGPSQAFLLGICCNWLVCLAIWMSYRVSEIGQKIPLIYLPIWLFVASGFEHSIANMYYLAAGFFASHDPQLLNLAGLSAANTAGLTFSACLHNLAFVTLGNILGGAIFVAGAYAISYGKKI